MDQPVKTILDDRKFSLYAKRPDGAKFPPRLTFGVWNGNASITVFTGEDGAKPIRVGMSADVWGTFVSQMQLIIDGPRDTHVKLVNYTGKPQDRKVSGTVIVGKDADGVVYLAVQLEGRPTKKFSIFPSMYLVIIHKDGTEYTPEEKSVGYAKGFIAQLDKHVTALMRSTWQPPQPRQPGGYKGGGNSGGYNSNRGGNSDFQNKAAQFDDDLPM
jgi:hypothetical protein